MRLSLAVATVAVLFACAAPANAAAIYTFSLSDGTGADPGSIVSFSFVPLGGGGELTIGKELDAFTPIVFAAVASGTSYPGATFTGFDGIISPATRVFEFAFTNVLFTSVQISGAVQPLETFTLVGEAVTITRGPASVPEPATLLLMATGAGLGLRRRRRVPGRAPRD